tara:strand:- start:259 stop:633 length:375 start_codon:yes stop_codon:yes gene_type:complete
MVNRSNLDDFRKYINPHAETLLKEYKQAINNDMWVTSIILSLTIIDNIFSDDSNLDFIDGIDLNYFKNSKDLKWLRLRRNKILHYEGPIEGFYGNNDSNNVLMKDALRAEKILQRCFEDLFNSI